MTSALLDTLFVGDWNGSGTSPSSSSCGPINTTLDGEVALLIFITDRQETATPDYAGVLTITTAAGTFTKVSHQTYTYGPLTGDSPGSFPYVYSTVDIWAAVIPTAGSYTWSATVDTSGDNFQNAAIGYVVTLANIDTTTIFDPNGGNFNLQTNLTGTSSDPSTSITTDNANPFVLNFAKTHNVGGSTGNLTAPSGFTAVTHNTSGQGVGTVPAISTMVAYKQFTGTPSGTSITVGTAGDYWHSLSIALNTVDDTSSTVKNWDPFVRSSVHVGITTTNNLLDTATSLSGSGNENAQSFISWASGTKYFEFTMPSWDGSQVGVGVGGDQDFGGNTPQFRIGAKLGVVSPAGSWSDILGSAMTGDIIGVVIDFDGGHAYTNDYTAATGWNGPSGAGTSDPVAKTGGYPLGSITTPSFINTWLQNNGTVIVLNTGAGSPGFAHTAPAGSDAWGDTLVTVTGAWASTEADDIFAAVGGQGNVGPWESTETTDIFAGTIETPTTGVWASTEVADVFAGLIYMPPRGTWASTEAPDTWGNYPGIELLGLDTHGAPTDPVNPVINTSGFDRIIILGMTDAAVGADRGRPKLITGITSAAGLNWQQRAVIVSGPDHDDVFSCLQVVWAYSHLPLVNETLTISYDAGEGSSITTAQKVQWFSVKGLNGNFNYPFADVDNANSVLGFAGGLAGTATTAELAVPLETGVPTSSGEITDPAMFDETNRATLDSGEVTVTSTGWTSGVLPYALSHSGKQANKFHFEVIAEHVTSDPKYGFALFQGSRPGLSPNAVASFAEGVCISFQSGDIVVDSGLAGFFGPCVDGDVVSFDVDADNALLWVRNVTQNTPYNGHASGDPGAAFNGIPIKGFDLYAFLIRAEAGFGDGGGADNVYTYEPMALPGIVSGGKITANFGQLPFEGAIPNGFTAGWSGGVKIVQPDAVYPTFVYGFADAHQGSPSPTLGVSPGYNGIDISTVGGSQRDISLLSQYKILHFAQPASAGDVQAGNTVPSWQVFADALKPGQNAPGEFVVTENADRFSALGYVGAFGIVGEVVAHETPDHFSAIGFEADSGIFVTTDTPDRFSAFGFQPLTGVWNSTEAADRFAATGLGRGEDGVWASTEAVDICQIIGNTPASGSFVTTETPDQFRAFGAGVVRNRRRRQVFVG